MARRYLLEKIRRDDVLENPEHTQHYLQARLRDVPHEVFACLFLDNRHRVIGVNG